MTRASVLTMLGLALATLTLGLGAARADVVGNPPSSCPAGSIPRTSHAGPTCEPVEACATGGVCPDGRSCVPIRQCIEQRACGGLREPDSGPCFIQHVTGLCGSDGSCASGTCTMRDVCPGAAGVSSGGCGCHVATRSAGGLTLLALASLLGWLGARRSNAHRA
jgi:hypothetical protein